MIRVFDENGDIVEVSGATGYTVTVTFTQIAASIIALGALMVSISSPVTFDLQAFETTP